MNVPNMTPGRAALVVLMHRYLGGSDGPVRDAARSAQADVFHAGGRRAAPPEIRQGPLRPLCRKSAARAECDRRASRVGVCGWRRRAGQADRARSRRGEGCRGVLDRTSATRVSRFDRVGKLVEGFETPFGLELLATVHWVATRENATDAEDAAAKVYAWNERKKRFSPRQIGIAFETLRAKGWLAAA